MGENKQVLEERVVSPVRRREVAFRE